MDLFGFLGLFGDAVDGALSTVVDWATAGFATLFGDIASVGGVISSLVSWITGALGSIVSFLSSIWDWLRNHILVRIVSFLTDLFNRLRQFFKPLIDAIHRQQQQMMLIWNIYIKPIINFIQALRRFLLIFRLLGFAWAKRLDSYLVDIENKLNLAFLNAVRNLNTLANWINFILNPLGPFGPVWILSGLGQSISAVWAMIWGAPQVGLSGAGIATYDTPAGYYSYSASQARINARLAAGELPEDSVLVNALRADAAADGYPPPQF